MIKDNEKELLVQEKLSLQETLKAMSEEVECLSKKNENFLKELKKRDFYQAYKQTTEEQMKLREAHAILINMISTKELIVDKTHCRKPSGKLTKGE